MVQYRQRYKKGIALDMRRRGFSYSEIQNRLGVPKSTLNSWLGKIKLDDELVKKLYNRKIEALRKSSTRRISQLKENIATIQNISSQEVSKISQRELWFMGVVLYWRERLGDDLRRGVRFSSADPYLLKFFLKWLREIGKIPDEEITFNIFVGADRRTMTDDIIEHWSRAIGFPKHKFAHIYFQKVYRRKKGSGRKRKSNPRTLDGFIQIRVKASSLLARQISGWIKGIQRQYWAVPGSTGDVLIGMVKIKKQEES